MTRHLVRFGLYLVIGFVPFGVALAQTPSKEYIRVNGRVLAIENQTPSACQGVSATLPLRNTGLDLNGNVITVIGAIDPTWKLISNPANYGGPSFDQVGMTTIAPATGVAAYIRQVGVLEALPGYYVYRQRLDLSCHDPATAILAGTVSADEFVTIYVNGKAVTGELNSAFQDLSFNIQNSPHFVKGWNDIDFVVRNGGIIPNTTGVRITFTTRTATPTPGNQGEKMELTSTSGNRTGGSSIAIGSDRAVNWSVDGSHSGSWTPSSGNSTTYTAANVLANFMVVSLKAVSQSNSATIAFKPLYFNASPTNVSTFVSGSSTLPPSTLVSAQTFNVALAFQNTGTTTWTAGTYSVASENGINWGTNNASLASNISPGATATFNLTLTAPTVASAQAVAFRWRMRDASNTFFGAVASQSTTISSSNIQISLSPTGVQLGYGTTRTYTITATGLVAGQNRTINLSRSSTNAAYQGSLSATSVTLSGTGATGSATFSYTAQACGQFCASPAPVITITATSVQDTSRTAVDQFSLTLPVQTLSSTMTSSGKQATLNITVSDPNTDTQITWAEFVLSPQSGSNGLPAGESCRFRVNRTGGQFQAGLDNSSGTSNYVYGTFGGGTLEHPGDPNPNACRILLGSSTGTVASGKTWNITLKVENLKMSGTRYLRGRTFSGPNSLPAPDSFLGPTWTLGALPAITITNSQNVAIPVIAEGQNLNLYMQVANLCPGCKAKFRLVQQSEGSLTSVANPSGYSAQANFAATSNAGSDRDIFIVPTIYLNESAWQNEDATQTDCNEDTCLATPYRIRVTSSFSSANLPSFPNTNPFVGSGTNPQPINATLTANGTTSHLIQFAVQNGPYDALATNPNAIDEFNFNINRKFTQSGLAQDRAGGCQLEFVISAGSFNKNYKLYLKADNGTSDAGSILGTFPETATGSISNSQCKVEIGSGIGTYAQTSPTNPTLLGFGIKITFFPSFSGERYVFMQSKRVNNAWTGWQYRGSINLQ